MTAERWPLLLALDTREVMGDRRVKRDPIPGWEAIEVVRADAYERADGALREARLLGESWIRGSDDQTRRMGADLLQLLDTERQRGQ